MTQIHPAMALLLTTALILYWLLPLVAWWMLRGHRNDKARLWFLGTIAYALAATLVAVTQSNGPAVAWAAIFFLTTLSMLLLSESLRRELPPFEPWGSRRVLIFCVFLPLFLLIALTFFDQSLARICFLIYVAAIEFYLITLAVRIKRNFHSRAMDVIILVLAMFIFSNLSRVAEWMITGQILPVLSFTPLTNFAVILNFLITVFYSFGYWGFVLEKAQRDIETASKQAIAANVREQAAQYQEYLAQERSQLLSRMGELGKLAQAGALSATIAHEINQPLSSIRLDIESAVVALENGNDGEQIKELLHHAGQENLRAAEIIRRIRKLFKEQGVERQMEVVDTLITRCLSLFSLNSMIHKVTIKEELHAPRAISLASGEFEHVLVNLLNNALDSVLATTERDKVIEIHSEQDNSLTRISISDNGAGIPIEFRDKLFDQAISSKSDGMGMGLWLARYIVERHRGKIFLDDSYQNGARFVIELPY